MSEVHGLDRENAKKMDENVKVACNLYAHLILAYRNVSTEDLNYRIVSTVLSSFMFLSSRHSWNQMLIEVPETELFECMQFTRRKIITWLA